MKKKESFGAFTVAVSYVIWGFLTIFWNLLSEVDSLYILAQRIVWSMVFMGIYLAVNGGHVLDASLGYFIEPILVALIGVLLFGERMSRMEKITFGFAAAGLLYMVVVSRTFPVMAILIAVSFAAYGAVKKSLKITAHASLFMETLCMAPFALLFLIYMEGKGAGSVGILHGAEFLLLPACGIVTSVPLLLFNMGVKEIPYYISGIIMYISPTIQFFMGLFYFREEMDVNRFIAFVLIWIGIFFTVFEKAKMIRDGRKSE